MEEREATNANDTMALCTSTEIFDVLTVDTYCRYAPEHIWDTSYEEEEAWEHGLIVSYDFDMPKFSYTLMQTVMDAANDFQMLSQYGVSGYKLSGFTSPREYNFRTDRADIEITVPKDFLDKAVTILKNNEAISNKYLSRWRSCDGFISFMDDNLDDLLDSIKELQASIDAETDYTDDFRVVGAVLGCLHQIGVHNGTEPSADTIESEVYNQMVALEYLDFVEAVSLDQIKADHPEAIDIEQDIETIKQSLAQYQQWPGISEASQRRAYYWAEKVCSELRELERMQAEALIGKGEYALFTMDEVLDKYRRLNGEKSAKLWKKLQSTDSSLVMNDIITHSTKIL